MEPGRLFKGADMNPLQRALIAKIGVDNGFECALAGDGDEMTLASARHPARSILSLSAAAFCVRFVSISKALQPELMRSFPEAVTADGVFRVGSEAVLAVLLRRAAGLSRALPNQAETAYQQMLVEELLVLPPGLAGTEVERMVRQRIGQQKFREAMLHYWGSACAVTGVAIPEVLRASHAKPWAECASDAERLDVFNGFLLTANLDALFDRFLISFDEEGRLIASPVLSASCLQQLGILPGATLRWLTPEHQQYLDFHRTRFIAPV